MPRAGRGAYHRGAIDGKKDAGMNELIQRPRRLRRGERLRSLVRETRLGREDLVLPLFACAGEGVRREVSSMPGVFNLSVDEAVKEVQAAKGDGVRSVLLFGLPDRKSVV